MNSGTFEDLVGRVVESVEGLVVGSERATLRFKDGSSLVMSWEPDGPGCDHHVSIEDVVGDPSDLVGRSLVMCEEVSSWKTTLLKALLAGEGTWTFYKFASAGGYVTVRWYGASNGYYSEAPQVRIEVGSPPLCL